MQVESLVPSGSCWLQWAGWVCPAARGMCCPTWASRPGWICRTGLVELLCFPAVGVTAPWCTVVFWSGSPLHIRGYWKGKDLLNIIKCVSFPPKQPVLVSLVIPVLACIPALNALRRHCCFSCSGDTIFYFHCLAPGVRIRPYQKSVWRCSRAIKNCGAKSRWLLKIPLLSWKMLVLNKIKFFF